MIRLGDLKAFGQTAPDGVFAHAEPLEEGAPTSREGPALIIQADVIGDKAAENFVLESDLATCGKVLLFPSISAVSGTFVKRGITFVPKGRALNTPYDMILPHPIGEFAGHGSPETAFRTAHSLWHNTPIPDICEQQYRLALGLSLGADATNGEWWLVGGMAGLLNLPIEPELASLIADPTDLLPTRNALSARVRQECRLPVQVLSMTQSATVKAMLTRHAPRENWAEFANDCESIKLTKIAARYRTAAERIWG